MVKVDFFRKIIQLWTEEYQGNITVPANFVCFINPQGISDLITLNSWNEQDVQKMNTTSSSIPITPATEQEKTKMTEGGIRVCAD